MYFCHHTLYMLRVSLSMLITCISQMNTSPLSPSSSRENRTSSSAIYHPQSLNADVVNGTASPYSFGVFA